VLSARRNASFLTLLSALRSFGLGGSSVTGWPTSLLDDLLGDFLDNLLLASCNCSSILNTLLGETFLFTWRLILLGSRFDLVGALALDLVGSFLFRSWWGRYLRLRFNDLRYRWLLRRHFWRWVHLGALGIDFDRSSEVVIFFLLCKLLDGDRSIVIFLRGRFGTDWYRLLRFWLINRGNLRDFLNVRYRWERLIFTNGRRLRHRWFWFLFLGGLWNLRHFRFRNLRHFRFRHLGYFWFRHLGYFRFRDFRDFGHFRFFRHLGHFRFFRDFGHFRFFRYLGHFRLRGDYWFFDLNALDIILGFFSDLDALDFVLGFFFLDFDALDVLRFLFFNLDAAESIVFWLRLGWFRLGWFRLRWFRLRWFRLGWFRLRLRLRWFRFGLGWFGFWLGRFRFGLRGLLDIGLLFFSLGNAKHGDFAICACLSHGAIWVHLDDGSIRLTGDHGTIDFNDVG
jgi:hypothetical protein